MTNHFFILICFINNLNSDQIAAFVTTYIPVISTIVVAVATVFLVCLTSKYVRLTKHMVDDLRKSKDPAINVDFELPDHWLRFVVKNVGQSPAKNIKFMVRKDINLIQGQNDQHGLFGIPPIKHGISYLVPGRTIKYLVGLPDWRQNETQDLVISLLVKFENDSGDVFEHSVDIDMNQFKGVLFESFKDSNLAVVDVIKETERNRRSDESMRSMTNRFIQKKTCSTCGETVMATAKKCIHCGEWINDENSQPEVGKEAVEDIPDAPSIEPST